MFHKNHSKFSQSIAASIFEDSIPIINSGAKSAEQTKSPEQKKPFFTERKNQQKR
jgi:hypothetical protein